MNVLLVYEMVPDEVKFYLIENPTEEQITTLAVACGSYQNGSDNSKKVEIALEKIGDAVTSDEYVNDCQHPAWACIWNQNQIKLPYHGKIDAVFNCGFLL